MTTSAGWFIAISLVSVWRLVIFRAEVRFFQHRVQAPEVGLPEAAIALHPFGGFDERLAFEAPGPALGVLTAGDEAGALEDLEVLRDGGLAHLERRGTIP